MFLLALLTSSAENLYFILFCSFWLPRLHLLSIKRGRGWERWGGGGGDRWRWRRLLAPSICVCCDVISCRWSRLSEHYRKYTFDFPTSCCDVGSENFQSFSFEYKSHLKEITEHLTLHFLFWWNSFVIQNSNNHSFWQKWRIFQEPLTDGNWCSLILTDGTWHSLMLTGAIWC